MTLSSSHQRTVEINGKSFTVVPNVKTYQGKKPIGKTTGMHLFGFLRAILANNEGWKVTDAHLVDLVMQEFSEFPEVIASIQGNANRSNKIPKYRSLYNTGELGILPDQVSFPYDSNQKPMKYPNRVLSKADCANVARHYRIPDSRYLPPEDVARFRRENTNSNKKTVVSQRKAVRSLDKIGRPNPRKKD